MARPLRIEYEGAVYHVTARGNERKDIFFSKIDYDRFLHYLKEAKKKYNIQLHCFALMSNHYHLIIETPEGNLSRVMHYINGSYTTYINVKKQRSGHLFQGRYKSILVDRDTYLLELSRYIHLNPVRAGMVEKPENYKHSSYPAYIKKRNRDLLTKELVLGLIKRRNSDARMAYRIFVESALGQEINNPMENAYGGVILGRARFIKDVLGRVKHEYLRKETVANRKKLRASSGIEEVLETVLTYYNVSLHDIKTNKLTEQKKTAIYLMKERTGASNREIGNIFAGMSASAVGKSYQRFKREITKNGKLRRNILTINKHLSSVGG